MQMQAMTHTDGVCVVVAPPGSGKTFVIIKRLEFLINKCNVSPSFIFVLSFTRLAANQMKERYVDVSSKDANLINFGTFHSIFLEILVRETNYTYQSIMNRKKKLSILNVVMKKLGLPFNNSSEFVGNIFSEISRWKNLGYGVFEDIAMPSCQYEAINEQDFVNIFNEMIVEQRLCNLLDFDDILTESYRKLNGDSKLLARVQERIKYVLVDEFQDTNMIQYELLRLVSFPQNNIFVVGDDDQSIYGFRGANPEIMNRISLEYRGAKVVKLDTNYRSTPNIVELAKVLISNNRNRFDKEYKANNEAGVANVFKIFENFEDEANYITDIIKSKYEKGCSYSDIAILVRTANLIHKFIPLFKINKIPYYIKENMTSFYDNEVIIDVFAYLKYAFMDEKSFYLRRIINRPNRYISQKSFDDYKFSYDMLEDFYQNNNAMYLVVCRLRKQIEMIRKMDPYGAINYIRRGIGYDEYVCGFEDSNKRVEAFEMLSELQHRAKNYSNMDEWFREIECERECKMDKSYNGGVNLMTIHATKGLEYEVVFLPDLTEGILPHRKATDEAEIEEERRLFYVGITRAKSELFCFGVEEKGDNPDYELSRFYKEVVEL